jgi:hypothetical protein
MVASTNTEIRFLGSLQSGRIALLTIVTPHLRACSSGKHTRKVRFIAHLLFAATLLTPTISRAQLDGWESLGGGILHAPSCLSWARTGSIASPGILSVLLKTVN